MIRKVTKLSRAGVGFLNEDQILADQERQIFGVFDGATSIDKYVSPGGKTGGFIASEIAAQTFAATAGDLGAIAMAANAKIEEAHREAGIDTADNTRRFGTSAVVAKILGSKAELLQVGDSLIIVIDKEDKASTPLGHQDHDIEFRRRWKALAAHINDADEIRKRMMPYVFRLRKLSNTDYGVLNGDPAVEKFIKTGQIDMSNIATMLILTDGMYIPREDPEAPDDSAAYVKLYKNGGLEAIYNTVRKMEQSDPNHIKYPRYKIHDDASAVAIDFE